MPITAVWFMSCVVAMTARGLSVVRLLRTWIRSRSNDAIEETIKCSSRIKCGSQSCEATLTKLL
jgi:hypothetical protein